MASAQTTPAVNDDIAELGYERARDELAAIVSRLEGGQATLEESMLLWERGEALAAHCESWLDGAQQRIARMTGEQPEDAGVDPETIDRKGPPLQEVGPR